MAFPDGWSRRYRVDPTQGLIVGSHIGYVGLLTEQSFSVNASDIFSNSDNGGGDLRASTDINGANQIPIQVTSWDTVAETGQIFVLHDVDNLGTPPIYIWCGNPGEVQPAPADPFGRNDTWAGSGFVQNTYGPLDSSGNLVVLDTEGAGTQVINSWGGPATRSPRYRLQDVTALRKGTGISITCWSQTTANGTLFGIRDNNDISYQVFRNTGIGLDLQIVGSDTTTRTIPNTQSSGWIRIDCLFNADLNIYVNGQLELTAIGALFDDAPGVPFRIGYRGAGGLTTVGFATNEDVGLVQARSGIIDSDLIETEFNNQNDPGAFYIAQAGEDVGLTVDLQFAADDIGFQSEINFLDPLTVDLNLNLDDVGFQSEINFLNAVTIGLNLQLDDVGFQSQVNFDNELVVGLNLNLDDVGFASSITIGSIFPIVKDDNSLIRVIIAILKQGLIDCNIEGVTVKQSYQPRQSGIVSGPAIYIHKLNTHRYGYTGEKQIYNANNDNFDVRNINYRLSQYQFTALSIRNPANIEQLTASDLAQAAADIFTLQSTVRELCNNNVGIEKITTVRDGYFIDERERNEQESSFDLTFIYKVEKLTTQPKVQRIDHQIERV